jgi:hypothetical protein
MSVLEVLENGTLVVPAEALGGAKPKARYSVEPQGDGVLLRAENVSEKPSPDEWWARFRQYSDAVTAASVSDASALDILSEMRR